MPEQQTAQLPVLIAGAGPTGLALANALARLGVGFRLIDKAAEPGTTSRAMGVQARTLEFYRQLGFADETVARGVRVAGANIWSRGRKLSRMPLGDVGKGISPFPYLLDFPQDQHEALLIEQLAQTGARVERQTTLESFEQSPGGVTARLRTPDGREELCQAQYLVGCDGARSAVREHGGYSFEGSTYKGLFYVADVTATGRAMDHEINVCIDDGDFVAVFPYRSDTAARLIGAVKDEHMDRAGELTFADARGQALDHLALNIESVNWFSTYHVHHRVVGRFSDGRVFLAGDAAHLHSPVGAQGMNTGIGDAFNLAWKLAGVVHNRAPRSLLETYHDERVAFARALVRTTDRLFGLITSENPGAAFVRRHVLPRLLPRVMASDRYRRFAFRTVSQTAIHYRNSPLSRGRAGKLRAGDRLPWVRLGAADNHEPLSSLTWQAHVYGQATNELRETCDQRALPLHTFAWEQSLHKAGFQRDALYLLRPDGYIALADPQASAGALRAFLDTQRLNLGAR